MRWPAAPVVGIDSATRDAYAGRPRSWRVIHEQIAYVLATSVYTTNRLQ